MRTKKWYGIEDLQKKYGPMTLGLLINAFRENEEMSQVEYAKRLKISRANLCDLEKGRKLVSPERAARLAKAMNLPEALLIQLALQDQLTSMNLHYKIELKSA